MWSTLSSNQNDMRMMLSTTFPTSDNSRNLFNSTINNDHPLQQPGESRRELSITSHHSTLNISELAEDLVELEKSTNATYVDHLKYLLKDSKVYRQGSWDGAGIVIEEYKLIFFTQGKVASTVFKQLVRRMMDLPDWKEHKEPDIPHKPEKNGLLYMYHYPPTLALAILTSPRWTRAIFVRDPKERTLSAYLDKVVKKNGLYVTRHCCKKEMEVKKMNTSFTTCGEVASSSFLAFLKLIQSKCCCDPHWGKQSSRIDTDFRPFINFVGHFERLQEDTKRLLDEVGDRLGGDRDLWKEFGASGWGSQGQDAIFAQSTRAIHQTSAITKLQHYYNRSVESLVDAIYKYDYNDPLLNFEPVSVNQK